MRTAALLAILLAVQEPPRFAGRCMDVFGDPETARLASADADAAGERFRGLIGAAPLRGALILTNGRPDLKTPSRELRPWTRHGAKWVWRWERTCGEKRDEYMTHELGHLWLIFWADGTKDPGVRRYGSSLPDWFDEAFACLLEGPVMQRAYAATARAKAEAGRAMPLEDLFTCIHPDSREDTEKEKARDRWLFYAQSWSVAEFLVRKYGADAFRHVAATLKAGRPFEAALGGRGLPKTLAEFEEAWTAWTIGLPSKGDEDSGSDRSRDRE